MWGSLSCDGGGGPASRADGKIEGETEMMQMMQDDVPYREYIVFFFSFNFIQVNLGLHACVQAGTPSPTAASPPSPPVVSGSPLYCM